jgi:glycosyltransferase involved in cell wall biosynthesis
MTIGGAQQVIRQLVENMDESEIHSEIVCIDNKLGELGEILQERGVKVHLLNRQPGFDFSLVKQLNHLIKTQRYDIIHCHQYSPYVYGLLGSILRSVKVIFTEHGRFYPDYGTWKRKLINPLLSIFTTRITAISEATKNALVRYENFRRDDIAVIPNGITDNSKIIINVSALKKEFEIPENVFIFGTISRLQPIKNQQMMIQAFKQVHDKIINTHLLIVGDGEIKHELEALSKKLNVSQSITFTGFQKDPYRFHKIIDIFLLSSFSEGASMSLLEAMSFSTPCVVTNVGGNTELIHQNKNGLVSTSDDMHSFSENMLKLIESDGLKLKLGKKSRDVYLARFTVKGMVENYLSIYLDLKKIK